MEILNNFNTISFSGKRKVFSKVFSNEKLSQKTGDRFLAGSNKIENASFHTKLPYQKPILVQNGHITKNGVVPVTTLFLKKFSFNLKTAYKKLI